MKKYRLIYYIFSIILSIFILCHTITHHEFLYGFIIIFFIMSINYLLKRKEKIIISKIMIDYSNSCNPINYINQLHDYYRSCFLTKKQKLSYKIYYAIAYIDNGEFEKAKELLLYLDNYEKMLNEICVVLYLKAWSDYFFHNNLDQKMLETLYKLKEVIMATKKMIYINDYKTIYTTQEAKYYILTNQNISKAKEILSKRTINSVLTAVSTNYYLGIIDLKEKKFEDGIKKLKKVSSTEKELYVVRKSKKLLESM